MWIRYIVHGTPQCKNGLQVARMVTAANILVRRGIILEHGKNVSANNRFPPNHQHQNHPPHHRLRGSRLTRAVPYELLQGTTAVGTAAHAWAWAAWTPAGLLAGTCGHLWGFYCDRWRAFSTPPEGPSPVAAGENALGLRIEAVSIPTVRHCELSPAEHLMR